MPASVRATIPGPPPRPATLLGRIRLASVPPDPLLERAAAITHDLTALLAQAHTELGELAAVAAELRTERSAISHKQSGDGRLLLSVPEACERLGVSRPTFERRFLRPGLVRTLWVGRRRMIVAEDLGRAIDRIAGEGR